MQTLVPKKNAVVKKAGMVGVCDIAQRSFPNLLRLVAVTATARPWQNLKARGCERFVLRRTEERPFVTKECDFGRLGLLPLGCGCVTGRSCTLWDPEEDATAEKELWKKMMRLCQTRCATPGVDRHTGELQSSHQSFC